MHRRRRTFTFWLAHNEFKLKRLSHRLSLLPIEIFVGEKDELFPPHKMKKFLTPFTNVRLHLIAKVGHQVISAELVAYLQAQKNLFFRSEK
jgi:pimeloyl-ACP methyl ester carboxylesterase